VRERGKPSVVRGKSEQHRPRCGATSAGPTCQHVLLRGMTEFAARSEKGTDGLSMSLPLRSYNCSSSILQTADSAGLTLANTATSSASASCSASRTSARLTHYNIHPSGRCQTCTIYCAHILLE
jgi:hypothetical protein